MGLSNGVKSLADKALRGFGGATAWTFGKGGSLLGNVVGGFLAGMYSARSGQAYHDAAKQTPGNSDWRAMLSSANQAILSELDTMLARSRRMIANDGWAASIQGGFNRLVVGGGITARSAARHPTDPKVGLLRTYNTIRDRLWEERVWNPKLCDAEQTKTMPEKQRVWLNELVAAGGVFVLSQYRPNVDAVALILQEIEYEQRDTTIYEYQGRPVRSGVEVGSYHEPVAYHLYAAGHPLDDYGTLSKRFDASNVYHVFRQDRVRQCVGTPWLKPVMERLRNLAMYEQYTMVQARGRAANVGFIAQENAATAQLPAAVARQLGMNNPQPTADDSEMRVNVAPGLWTVLKPGQKPYMPEPGSPDTMYPPFVLEHLKGISAGTGLDFTTVCRWYAEASFAGNRQAKLDVQAEVDVIQDLLFIHKICRADRELWTTLNIREGRLPATGFFESPVWRAAYLTDNWQGPPRNAVDEIKDEAAWDMKIKSGRASPQDYCNEHGKSLEQVLSEIAEFRQLAADQGVSDMVDSWLLGKSSSPNTPKTGMKPDDPTPPDNNADNSAGSDLASLVARQHVLNGLLDEGDRRKGKQP